MQVIDHVHDHSLVPRLAGAKKLRMTVYPMSDLEHNQQIFAGLELLRSKGELEFKYRYDGARLFGLKPKSLNAKASAWLTLVCRIEGMGDVAFDLSDGDVVEDSICDRTFLYFKRSYDERVHGSNPKILPLGLNYEARSPLRSFVSALTRAIRLRRSMRSTGRSICRALHFSYPHMLDARSGYCLTPAEDLNVLFMARVYDPQEQGSSPAERSEINALNDMRADCVLRLRRELGTAFTGGLINDSFASRHYSDCTVGAEFPTDRRSFLKLVDDHHICVATSGLFDSIGWKFAEYLAKGRAVVSERLRFSVPGPFSEGVNYLPFSTARECVEQCHALRADSARTRRMMVANRAYYLGFVEPEAIVWNAFQEVLAATQTHRIRSSFAL